MRFKTAKDLGAGRVGTIRGYVDELARFDLAPYGNRTRVLDVRIPPGASTDGIELMMGYAESKGVVLRAAEFP